MRKIIIGAVVLALFIPTTAMAYTVHVKPIRGKALAAAVHAKAIGFRNKQPTGVLRCYVGFQQKVAPGPGTGGIVKYRVVAYSNWAMHGSKRIFRKACGGEGQKIMTLPGQMFISTENNGRWGWLPWDTFWGWLPYPPDTQTLVGRGNEVVPKPVARALLKAVENQTR
jgi:hypothetical protein